MQKIRLLILCMFFSVPCQAFFFDYDSYLECLKQQIDITQYHSDVLQLINIDLFIKNISIGLLIGTTINIKNGINGVRQLCLRQETKIKKLKHRINEIHEQDLYAHKLAEKDDDA